LAAVGIYGVISYTVRRRTREFGIRIALGARPGAVLAAVLRQGLGLAGIGVVAGLGVAAALSRLFSSYLFGIRPTDPLTFVTVSLSLMGTAIAVTLAPALRAAHIQPSEALRVE
jgi:ABC-type antimicrobial peptide transport system permease subunit